MGNVPLSGLGAKAKVTYCPPVVCEAKTSIFLLTCLPRTYRVATHKACICNERAALYNRHLVNRTTAQYDVRYIKQVTAKLIQKIIQHCAAVTPISYSEVIKKYNGPKRASYLRAKQNLVGWFNPNYARVKMFVKPDKYIYGECKKKAPRAIQYRSPEFNLALARYLEPFEKQFYQIREKGLLAIAKGRNNLERAMMIKEMGDKFDRPCFMMADHSKYDSCITVDLLKLARQCYLGVFPSERLAYLLSLQTFNKGISSHGIRYQVQGTKMSGDYNTALDNTLINYLCLASFFRLHNIEAAFLIDGDDSVICFEEEHLGLVRAKFAEHTLRFGFTTCFEMETDIDKVEFCRARYLPATEPILAREPWRALSNMTVGTKRYEGRAKYKYLAGNALGEMHRSAGVPVIFPIAKRLYEKYSRLGVILDEDTRYKLQTRVKDFPQITLEARMAFFKAYGLNLAEQEILEKFDPVEISALGLFVYHSSLPKHLSDVEECV